MLIQDETNSIRRIILLGALGALLVGCEPQQSADRGKGDDGGDGGGEVVSECEQQTGERIEHGDMSEPSSQFLQQSTIAHSAKFGVVRGWRGAPIDFVAGNVFEDVASCLQTHPRDDNGACPVPAPCP